MVDRVAKGVHDTLLEFLSTPFQRLFQLQYQDLWEDFIARRPPWTVEDLFVLIDKHWNAVFVKIISLDYRSHLSWLNSFAKDLTRGERVGKSKVTRGELIKFLNYPRWFLQVCEKAGFSANGQTLQKRFEEYKRMLG